MSTAETYDTNTANNSKASTDTKNKINDPLTVLDKQWLKNSYLLSLDDLGETEQPNAFWSNAYLKYTDTSLGGNFGINTKYGYTPTADIPIPGRMSGREEVDAISETLNFGMGRLYSEVHDDNDQILFLEFGDPKFNSFISYITNAIDYGTSVVANTGRSLSAYYVGKAAGTIVGVSAVFMAFPLWGAALFLAGVAVTSFVTMGSDFTYYRLGPSMYKYWSIVNTLASQFGIELGIFTPEFTTSEKNENKLGMPVKITSEFMDDLKELIPGIVTDENYIDVFAVANKTQLMYNMQKSLEREYYNSDGSKVFTYADKIAKQDAKSFSSYLDELFKVFKDTSVLQDTNKVTTDNQGAIEKLTGDNPTSAVVGDSTTPTNSINDDGTVNVSTEGKTEKSTWLNEFSKYVDASARFGASYATFRVEYLGSATDTFNTEVKDVPLKDTINQVGKKVKDLKFSASGGNIIGDSVDTVMNYAKDFMMGAIEGITFNLSSVIPAIMGGAFYDIPQMAGDSSFQVQKHTFRMRLGGPYGDDFSLLQDIFIPISMLLAGACPQATGKASYTSPMLCSAFVKGQLNGHLGVIDSLSITRGVSSLGYNKRGKTLAADITFTYTDFSNIVTAPVSAGIFSGISAALDDSSPMSRYIQTLAARDFYTSKYTAPKLRLKYMKLKQGIDMITNPSAIGTAAGQVVGGSPIGGLLQGFSLPYSQLN